MRSVLIIEDDEDARLLIRQYLKDSNLQFQIAEAGTAHEGLQSMQLYFPDIVLLDIGLPDKSGMNVLHYIKRDGILRHIYVIIISAHNDPETVKGSIDQGANDFLAKPIDQKKFMAKLKNGYEFQNLHRRVTGGESDIEVHRHAGFSEFMILGPLDKQTLEAFDKIFDNEFRYQSQKDIYILDLRYMPGLTKNDLAGVKTIIEALGAHKLKVVAGRNFAIMLSMNFEVGTNLFVTRDDLDRVLAEQKII